MASCVPGVKFSWQPLETPAKFWMIEGNRVSCTQSQEIVDWYEHLTSLPRKSAIQVGRRQISIRAMMTGKHLAYQLAFLGLEQSMSKFL